MSIDLEQIPAESQAERWIQNRNAWEAPRLQSLDESTIRRWSGPTWIPPGTMGLVRHRSDDGLRCLVSTDRRPPPGFTIEYDLGLVHAVAQPGTQRVIEDGKTYFSTPFEGELAEGYRGLGYIEQAPLPMLDALELRRDPASDQHVLVAGTEDPLYKSAIPLGTLGFIESYPINPRRAPPHHEMNWALSTLIRTVDMQHWRHSYEQVERRPAESVALGAIWHRPGPSFVALYREPDGRLYSELLQTDCRGPTWRDKLRWSAAPLTWTEGRPRIWAMRATAGRLQRLGLERRQPEVRELNRANKLGYLRRSPISGWSPLYSAIHPALGDQYITRSEIEATDMGYLIEGLLGYVLDRFSDRSIAALPPEVKWGSRFGQRRRYVEGPAPT